MFSVKGQTVDILEPEKQAPLQLCSGAAVGPKRPQTKPNPVRAAGRQENFICGPSHLNATPFSRITDYSSFPVV